MCRPSRSKARTPSVAMPSATPAPVPGTTAANRKNPISNTAPSRSGSKRYRCSKTNRPPPTQEPIKASPAGTATQSARAPHSLPRALQPDGPGILLAVRVQRQGRPPASARDAAQRIPATTGPAYRRTLPPPCSGYRTMLITAPSLVRRAASSHRPRSTP